HNSIGDLGFRYLYVGAADVQWDDAFGLDLLYMHARHYHPALGRFLTPDPARAEANGYAYAENSPVTKIDPVGTFALAIPIGWVIIAVAALAINAVLQTAIYLQRNPVIVRFEPVQLSWGKTFEDLETQKIRKKWPGNWIQPRVRFFVNGHVRVLDACRYHTVLHWILDPAHPIECYEIKSTEDAKDSYFRTTRGQYDDDREIMRIYRFPILVVWGRCNWRYGNLYCR
ncbi:MAG: RHS repeat-associated core domain-containing protein, partial [Myxococcales bacterium]|nr:RHS repeat-associated core domain-containing protein [Myxococcales bacterium]